MPSFSKRRLDRDTPAFSAADVIFNEAERMAEIVRKIGKITKYETKSYVGAANILDLDKSSEETQPAGPVDPDEATDEAPRTQLSAETSPGSVREASPAHQRDRQPPSKRASRTTRDPVGDFPSPWLAQLLGVSCDPPDPGGPRGGRVPRWSRRSATVVPGPRFGVLRGDEDKAQGGPLMLRIGSPWARTRPR